MIFDRCKKTSIGVLAFLEYSKTNFYPRSSPFMIAISRQHFKYSRGWIGSDVLVQRRHPVADQGKPEATSERYNPEM